MKPAEKGRQGESTPRLPHTPITASVSGGAAFVFTASVSSGAGNGINGMLRKKYHVVRKKYHVVRKKYHVVRKKYHVVRKLFYVASIFGGAARRRNRPPWDVSSTAGDFSPTASRRRQRLQCVYRAPVFSGGAHTRLPDTHNTKQAGRPRGLPACFVFARREFKPRWGARCRPPRRPCSRGFPAWR